MMGGCLIENIFGTKYIFVFGTLAVKEYSESHVD
jgi:hypothetical protein